MTTEPAPAQAKAAKIVKTANGAAHRADRKVTALGNRADRKISALEKNADREINTMANRAESAARRAEAVLHEGIETLRSQTQTYVETAARGLDEARNSVSDKVRERPLTGLLAAAGIGLLLGMLIGRRR